MDSGRIVFCRWLCAPCVVRESARRIASVDAYITCVAPPHNMSTKHKTNDTQRHHLSGYNSGNSTQEVQQNKGNNILSISNPRQQQKSVCTGLPHTRWSDACPILLAPLAQGHRGCHGSRGFATCSQVHSDSTDRGTHTLQHVKSSRDFTLVCIPSVDGLECRRQSRKRIRPYPAAP